LLHRNPPRFQRHRMRLPHKPEAPAKGAGHKPEALAKGPSLALQACEDDTPPSASGFFPIEGEALGVIALRNGPDEPPSLALQACVSVRRSASRSSIAIHVDNGAL